MKILVTPTSLCKDKDSEAFRSLRDFAGEVVCNPHGRPLNADEVIELLSGVDGYVAGLDFITADVIAQAPASLKVISRYGTGFERVDIEAAGKKGIVVTNTPGVNAQSVADLALGLLLSAARKIPSLDSRVRKGEWPRTSGVELYGKTIGIVGFGHIGRCVAKRTAGFSMKILTYDPYLDQRYLTETGAAECTLDELLEGSDFISLHLPLNDGTRNIIDKEAIGKMKQGAILINTSRGGLLDEQTAYEALKSGKLGGLGLDAFEKEPPGPSPLYELDNVVFTPHAGAHTVEAVEKMALMSVKNLIDVLSGKECGAIVNGKYLENVVGKAGM